MTAAFGEVTYADAPAEASAAPGDQSAAIDPNDPRLTSEVLTINPDADAYAVLPPLPDGKWRAKAKQVDIKDKKTGQMQRFITAEAVRKDGSAWQAGPSGKPAAYFATNVELSIIDHSGTFDGVKMTEYWLKSLVDPKRGTSQMATLTNKLGGKALPQATQKQTLDLFLQTLAAEPELVIETAWSAECQTCQESAEKKGDKQPRPFLQGMHRFKPTREPGVYDPIVQCTTCKSQVRAQPRIVGFFSLKESQPTRGTGHAAAK
jgi:hypothetical protein